MRDSERAPGGAVVRGESVSSSRDALLLTRDQAAALCNVSPRAWIRMVQHGEAPAPAIRRHRLVRWSREDLTAWVAAGCPDADAWEAMGRRRRAGLAS